VEGEIDDDVYNGILMHYDSAMHNLGPLVSRGNY
jgi:hypothetical protein